MRSDIPLTQVPTNMQPPVADLPVSKPPLLQLNPKYVDFGNQPVGDEEPSKGNQADKPLLSSVDLGLVTKG